MDALGVIAWFGAVILAAVIALLLATAPPRAHEAPSGWAYPQRCCSDGDCAVATSAIRNTDGSLTITTKHGTATFPADFKYEESPDGMIHGCFIGSRLYCLFLATGI